MTIGWQNMASDRPKVLISYGHDSPEQKRSRAGARQN
jgi:hypothetical protein